MFHTILLVIPGLSFSSLSSSHHLYLFSPNFTHRFILYCVYSIIIGEPRILSRWGSLRLTFYAQNVLIGALSLLPADLLHKPVKYGSVIMYPSYVDIGAYRTNCNGSTGEKRYSKGICSSESQHSGQARFGGTICHACEYGMHTLDHLEGFWLV